MLISNLSLLGAFSILHYQHVQLIGLALQILFAGLIGREGLMSTFTRGLLFYDRNAGRGEFYAVDNLGYITWLNGYDDWGKNWALIVPVDFSPGPSQTQTSLLFYNRAAGQGQFYSTNNDGGISPLKGYTDWSTGWDKILPLNFRGSGTTSLLLYDSAGGSVALYSTDGQGNISLLRNFQNQARSWEQIVSGDLTAASGSGELDLLYYDRAAGQGSLSSATSDGNIVPVQGYAGLRTSWAQIVPLVWFVIS